MPHKDAEFARNFPRGGYSCACRRKGRAREWLKANPDKALEIENKIRAIKGMKSKTMSLDAPAPEVKTEKEDKKASAKKAKAVKEAPAAAAVEKGGADVVREPIDDTVDETAIDPAELYE